MATGAQARSCSPLNARAVRFFPSLTDLAFLLPALLLFAKMSGAKSLLADGDTGWHIRTGEWILQHRAVPTSDFFSFTMSHRPWFAWEWGWDVGSALIYREFGLAGVVFANVALLGLISVLLFRLVRRACDNDLLAILCTSVALCASSIHWLARPHLFSWLFTLVFAHAIFSADAGDRRALKWLPLTTVFWTNVHGGFFIGIILLLISAVGEVAGTIFASEVPWRCVWTRSRPYVLCSAGCVAASFVNPYTWHLHQHILSYLTDTKLLDRIQEFQSIDFHSAGNMFFESMLLLGAAAALWCFQARKYGPCFLVLAWAHLALMSARNIPIFALLAAPWIACLLRALPDYVQARAWLRRVGRPLSDIYADLRMFERIKRIPACSAAAIAVIALLFTTRRPEFVAQFDSEKFPIRAIPVLQQAGSSRVFTYDQWGDYLIYRMYPANQVFVDGRSDFYGPDFVDRYLSMLNARYDWERDLQRFAVDTVLLKPDAPLATVLKTSPHWSVLFDDGSLVVFRARGGMKTHSVDAAQQVRFSPVSHNGGNELGAGTGLQVNGSNSRLTSHERRSL